jgi:hypothetical protein
MNITSELQETSKLYPDISYRIRRLNMLQRADIDMQTLALRQRQREIQLDYPAFTDRERELRDQLALAYRKLRALPADEAGPAITEIEEITQATREAAPEGAEKRRALLDMEFELVAVQLKPYFIRAALVSVDGLTIDDKPVPLAGFVEASPPELADEVYQSIEAHMRLSGDQAKNSPSPSTSGAVEGERTTSTTAPNADAPPIPITSVVTA